jgi:hypothetical protein
MSNNEIRLLLKPYVIAIFITDALLQSTRNEIRDIVFGDPRENVHYIFELTRHLEELAHDFEVYTRTQQEVKHKLEELVVHETQAKLRMKGVKLLCKDTLDIVAKWNKKCSDVGRGRITLSFPGLTSVKHVFSPP